MRMRKALIIAVFFSLNCAAPAAAEIRQCDGVWTNSPCENVDLRGYSISVQPEPSPEQKRLETRKLWLHELDMLRLRAKREFEIQASVEHVRAACLNPETDDEACAKLVAQREEEIQSLIIAREKVRAKQRKAEEAETPPAPQVVVIEPERRHHHHHGYRVEEDLRYEPGPFATHRRPLRNRPHRHYYGGHEERHRESAGVRAGFRSNDGQVSVDVSAGTSTSTTHSR